MSAINLFVANAGLVLFQHFIPAYLERLQLLNNKQFCSVEAQRKAVHYIQLLATGQTETEERQLALNRLLCGLPFSEPVGIGITPATQELAKAESLIRAVIDIWPAVGSLSTDNFRQSFLIRAGTLIEQENSWELAVEKMAYDILLNQFPANYSTIYFPWMEKPLYVTWP
ncbi:MAG: hypothetical protein AUJ57_06130 [Zetaproteobacteria bacterium CG1_02_53_45]|nr:MAG: hypothetical protein AUJ57_06130 [Zetaproteobacteria bacterium CG1_02_53_45]